MSAKTVNHEPKEAEVVDDVKSRPVEKRDWNVGSLFWGLLLVLVGGLLLADNFDLVNIHWGNVWMLWPLFIIAAGLSMLSVRNLAWKIASAILAVATLVFIGFVAVTDYRGPVAVTNSETSVVADSSDVKTAKVIIKAGASRIDINSADQDEVVKAELESNAARLEEKTTRDGSKQTTELSMESLRHWWFGSIRNDLNVVLGRTLPIDLALDYGAAEANIDLAEVRATNVSLKTGASSTVLTLGDREGVTGVTIDSGASSITLRVPKGSGIRLNLSSGMASHDLADLQKVGDDVYESPEYSKATKVVNVEVKIGMASFKIERY